MKKSNLILLSVTLVFLQFCRKNQTAASHVLFESGFEGGVYIDQTVDPDATDFQFIRGKDSQTGYTWPINIFGGSKSGLHYLFDDNKQAVFSELQTVVGHDGNLTKALYSQQNYENGYTQNPYEILNIKKNGRKDMYISYWMKLDSASLTQKDKWRALFEYKTVGYEIALDKGTGFRLIAYIYTDKNGTPYWHFQGDKNPTHPYWEVDNKTIPVPKNEWFKTEFYWHWGGKKEGRAWWKINGELVAEVQDRTTRNKKPIDFIILTQIYGNANPKHQWIDDIVIWEGTP